MKTIKSPFQGVLALNLILSAAILIAGAVLRRTQAETGEWITIAGLGWYAVTSALPAGRTFRRFAALKPRERAHLFIVGVMLVLFVRAFFVIDGLTYFMSLVLLAVDYLLLEPASVPPGK